MSFRTRLLSLGMALLCVTTVSGRMEAQMAAPELASQSYGPYSGRFLFGGRGLERALPAEVRMLQADVPWTMSLWFEEGEGAPGSVLLGGIGDPG